MEILGWIRDYMPFQKRMRDIDSNLKHDYYEFALSN
jgi:hypothetical protein